MKFIEGKLWLQWQHPEDKFPRYSTEVVKNQFADTFRHVRFLIDMTIKLEEEAERHAVNPHNTLATTITTGSDGAIAPKKGYSPLRGVMSYEL